MSSMYVVMIASLFGLFLIVLLPLLKTVRQIMWIRNKLVKFLCWNFFLRLILTTSLELSFSIMLNTPYMGNFERAFFLEKTDYLMTVFIGTVLLISPFFILTFYGYNFDRLDDTRFKDTYGSVYDGMKPNLRASIGFSILFIVRRIIFAATCLYLTDSLWLQMLSTIYVTTFKACLLLHYKPHSEPLL